MGLRADICICLIKNKIVVVVERVEKLDGEENAHEQRKWGESFSGGMVGKMWNVWKEMGGGGKM